MAKQRRVYRVAEKIRNTIAMELLNLADPRFYLVTVTSVMVSPDLRQAKVYWMVSAPERRSEVEEAFASAQGIFKKGLGEALGVKFIPELRFYYDDTLDTAEDVERLFARIRAEDAEKQ